MMNHNETDIDCGGPLCPPCNLSQVGCVSVQVEPMTCSKLAIQACSSSQDCGIDSVCLGFYSHPSRLDFPFNVQANSTCGMIIELGSG